MRIHFLIMPVLVILATLSGCSKSPECPEITTIVYEDVSNTGGVESYSCQAVTGILELTWCEAKEQFTSQSFENDDFPAYLHGFREGYARASQAEDYQILAAESQLPHERGYKDGYHAVVDAMGIPEYNCGSADQSSEYKDRWCEAAEAFRSSGAGAEQNPLVRGRFVDGYMTGGRVALTVPTSMEAFFGGENPEGNQPAIARPQGAVNSADAAFYSGFDVGFKAMIDSIRESINQVMEQMQIPGNMDLPEGLMPLPPEQQ